VIPVVAPRGSGIQTCYLGALLTCPLRATPRLPLVWVAGTGHADKTVQEFTVQLTTLAFAA